MQKFSKLSIDFRRFRRHSVYAEFFKYGLPSGLAELARSFRVGQQRFDSFFKILPWEGAGIFVVAPGSVLYLGEMLNGTPVTLQFAPGNSRLNWLGKCPWPNGAVSWLRFDTADQKHYFSSETGIMIFGSHGSTKAIYDEANKNFGAHGQ